jgi:hypothetical protein
MNVVTIRDSLVIRKILVHSIERVSISQPPSFGSVGQALWQL